ncbi:PREDICTED: uncharacterized protein LOC104715716 [Camelina sativa]|uniref:Uncharacterized protein LOC104715716 n=1 Tax=Camelina sativa TaxID=90675 RepID=A0ABM0TU06_CAMSA|nr:PREDICTED: uncharacterized protein LOC104715716 [Camelina sativa]
MAMTRLISNDNSTEEDLFDMSDEDRFFDVDALFSNEEEEEDGVDTQQQQQEQRTPILPHQQPDYCLLPAEHQKPQTQPFPYNFPELISFEQEPVIPEDFEDFFADFIKPHSLNGDEDSSSYGLFEGFDTQGMIKDCTN